MAKENDYHPFATIRRSLSAKVRESLTSLRNRVSSPRKVAAGSQQGSIDDNLKRWERQVSERESREKEQRDDLDVNSVTSLAEDARSVSSSKKELVVATAAHVGGSGGEGRMSVGKEEDGLDGRYYRAERVRRGGSH